MVNRAVSCLLGAAVICASALSAPAQDCPELVGWWQDGDAWPALLTVREPRSMGVKIPATGRF